MGAHAAAGLGGAGPVGRAGASPSARLVSWSSGCRPKPLPRHGPFRHGHAKFPTKHPTKWTGVSRAEPHRCGVERLPWETRGPLCRLGGVLRMAHVRLRDVAYGEVILGC